MPKFITVTEGKTVWVPEGSVLFMEDADGRLTTSVTAVIPTPKGPQAVTLEVEGRCAGHADRLDRVDPEKEAKVPLA